MFHRSARLFLRPAWPEDWQAVLHGVGDERVVRNLANASWPYTAADVRNFIALPVAANYPRFLLTLPRAGQTTHIVGCIGIDPSGESGADAELGYWISRECWGQGFATEATMAMLEVAAMLGHRTVSAGHYVDNPASGRVLRKAGFAPAGRNEMRDCRARGMAAECVMYERDLSDLEVGLKAA